MDPLVRNGSYLLEIRFGGALVKKVGLWAGDQVRSAPVKNGGPGFEVRLGGTLVRNGSSRVGAGLGVRAGLRLITRDNSHGRQRCWRADKFSR